MRLVFRFRDLVVVGRLEVVISSELVILGVGCVFFREGCGCGVKSNLECKRK